MGESGTSNEEIEIPEEWLKRAKEQKKE